jgi:hypothetical protein
MENIDCIAQELTTGVYDTNNNFYCQCGETIEATLNGAKDLYAVEEHLEYRHDKKKN